MSSKFEQLLDYLVNEETEKANELFHEIVVEKSREIYENLIAEEEEESVEEMTDDEDESVDEASEDDEDDSVDEGFGGEENEEEFPVQDQTDDLSGEVGDADAMGGDEFGGDEFGGDEGGSEPATKDDVLDLKSALDELQAEFEALMGAERNEEEKEPGVHDDEEGNDPLDSVDDAESDDEEESDEEDEAFPMQESRTTAKKSQGETMREYIERVSVAMADGEGVGSGRGDKAGQTGGVIKHSPISSAKGKPETGANAKNIAQKGMGENQDGQSPHQPKNTGVLKRGDKFTSAGTHNVDGVKSGIKTVKAVPKPGNKEGAGVGAVAGGDKAGQTGGVQTRSPLTGAPHRNA